MALNIKDPETDRLARRLAQTTGESLTDAIRIAMAERLSRIERRSDRAGRAAKLQTYVERGRARATLDERPAEQILGYDAEGLPS